MLHHGRIAPSRRFHVAFLAFIVTALTAPLTLANPESGIDDCKNDDECKEGAKADCGDCGTKTCVGGKWTDCSGSFVNAINRVYIHFATDYAVGSTGLPAGLSCASCGEAGAASAGGLPRLALTRAHKEHGASGASGSFSFGRNVGLTYDVSLILYGGPKPRTEVSDINTSGPRYDVQDLRVGDGFVPDGISGMPGSVVKTLTWLDAAGNPTPTVEDVASIELLRDDGSRQVFEAFVDNSGQARGRITRIEDRNGNAIVVEYLHPATATDAQLGGDRERLWIKSTVTDAYGNAAAFTYTDQPLPDWGHHVVERIDLPNGESITYRYGETGNVPNRLTSVLLPDGTTSRFAYGVDEEVQANTIEIQDAAAEGTHRTKKVWFTAALFDGQNQASGRIRKMENGAGELSYAVWDEPRPDGPGFYTLAYSGGNTVQRYLVDNGVVKRAETARAVTISPDLDFTFPEGWELEQTYQGHTHTLPAAVADALGRQTPFTARDPARYLILEETHPDGSTSSKDYHPEFNWCTREVDRLGRVTTYTLDANGNRLSKTISAGPDVGTEDPSNAVLPGYDASATWSWTYNDRGQPLTETDANGNVTEYFYSPTGDPADIDNAAGGYLVEVRDPADVPGGPRASTLYRYDVASGGRLEETVDPLGRVVTYAYDARDRITRVGYFDGSERTLTYGSPVPDAGPGDPSFSIGDANLLVSTTDRTGNLTLFGYDAHGRKTIETVAVGTPVQEETTFAYLTGTNDKVVERTRLGEIITTGYDFHNRVVSTTVQPDGGTSLTSTRSYDAGQRLRSTTDAYGRSTYFGYDINDRKIRTAAETAPGAVTLPHDDTTAQGTLDNDTFLLGLARDTGPNAAYLIEDCALDPLGQELTCTDPRGITDTFGYDVQGRRIVSVEAFTLSTTFALDANGLRIPNDGGSASPVAGRTETDFDPQGNVVEVRSPRVFESGPEGDPAARTAMTYTGRNLLASRTEAPGAPEQATTSFTYNLDETLDQQTDARGNAWARLWGICCARLMAVIDPPADVDGDGDLERSATVTRHDFHGNLTHEGRVIDVDAVTFPNVQLTGSNSTDLPDGGTLSETTTRYDARHRPVASTSWMVPLGAVDPDNVPIAGGGAPGDPAVLDPDGNPNGLTTTYTFDDDLTDGLGLDAAHASVIASRLGAGFFTTGSDGSAVAVTNPEGETTTRFADGLGRTVLTVDPTGDPASTDFDAIATLAGFGEAVETVRTDALGHGSASQTDGAGRTLATVDAEGFSTTYSYDANGNLVSFRDPNGVGENCVYDWRDRKELCRDTQEIAEGTSRVYGYDANSNLVLERDASGTDDTCVYDARDRKTVCTDRVGAVTTYAYDPNSNLLSITDGEGGLTSYTYDARNLQTLTVYPNDGSQPGGLDPVGGDRVAMAYDGLRRPSAKTDQAGIVTGFGYDLAGRMTERSYSNGGGIDVALFERPFDAPGGYFDYRGTTQEHTNQFGAPAGGNALVVTANGSTTANNNGGIRLDLRNTGLEVAKDYRISYWARGLDAAGTLTFSHQNGQGGNTTLGHSRQLTTDWVFYERSFNLNAERDFLYIWSNSANGPNYRFALDGLVIEQVAGGTPTLADTDEFTYDLASRLLEARKGRYGNRVGVTYTDDGLIETETLTLEPGTPGNTTGTDRSFMITRGYDADDRLVDIRYPGDEVDLIRYHTPRDQLAAIDLVQVGERLVSIDYDAGMRETYREYANGLDRSTDYARADNLVTSHEVGGLSELSLAYEYAGPNKNLTKEERFGVMAPATFTAGHDPGDRLINWDRDNGELRAWNLSLVGDWDQYSGTANGSPFTQTRTHNPVHEILDVTSDSTAPGLAGGDVEHDAKGNIIEESSAGSLRTYTFDADNMLATASVLGGGAEAGSYTYDALNRRVTKTTNSGTTVFVSLSDPSGSGMGQVIQEYEDASSTPSRQYVYGSYVDEPLAQVTNTGDLLFYHRNRQFNVVGLTDASGDVQELYRYTPYGSQTILAPNGVTVRTVSSFHAGQTPGQQGLHHDAESGLIYNRARYRHTGIGRFLTRDGLGYIDGLGLYLSYSVLYNGVDPTGYTCKNVATGEAALAKLGDLGQKMRRLKRGLKRLKGASVGAGLVTASFNSTYSISASVDECCCDDGSKAYSGAASISGSATGEIRGLAGLGGIVRAGKYASVGLFGGFEAFGSVGYGIGLSGTYDGCNGNVDVDWPDEVTVCGGVGGGVAVFAKAKVSVFGINKRVNLGEIHGGVKGTACFDINWVSGAVSANYGKSSVVAYASYNASVLGVNVSFGKEWCLLGCG